MEMDLSDIFILCEKQRQVLGWRRVVQYFYSLSQYNETNVMHFSFNFIES
jgi:hypothetical protein